ncbi:MAG: TRAM domain-containing protein, partial [Opitutaceae bacterium]|nr:TRAM domain-containing protein [Opitutaceae bacterium]
LAKPGKENGQAIGYLPDGSMVVVENAGQHIGRSVMAEITSVLPTAGGKMVFARYAGPTE